MNIASTDCKGPRTDKTDARPKAFVAVTMFACALFALAGCVQTVAVPGPYGEVKPFAPTAQEQQAMINIGHANAIAKFCPTEFKLNKPYRDKFLMPFGERVAASGKRRVGFEDLMGMSKEQGRAIGLAYEKERGIISSDRGTWCSAGRYEITNKTGVGSYLLRTGS